MATLININTANPKDLTQLPGIAKNLAYRIVSHRKRHGYFTHWEELLEVRDFSEDSLDELKNRATIDPPEGILKEEFGPRRLKPGQIERVSKKTKGYTKAIRSTRTPDRLKRPA
jgi:competence ComEA-like helix-hairpin-helix protein